MSHIALAGAASNWCIRATAHGALERGYDLTLIEDAHTTETTVLEDGRTLVVKVVLKPGQTYRYWLNSKRHQGFKNRAGVPLEQVAVTFRTTGEPGTEVEDEPDGPAVTFDLEDVNGVRIRSQDYAGVPIFIAFGAAW